MSYPTKEQIMASPVIFKKQTVAAMNRWKRIRRKVKKNSPWNNDTKFQTLQLLIGDLNQAYNTDCNLEYNNIPSPCYIPISKTIVMNNSLSIISVLHEFAHHLFGPDELKACRWSVWLFKKTFPKAFDKLTWQDHMLIRKDDEV